MPLTLSLKRNIDSVNLSSKTTAITFASAINDDGVSTPLISVVQSGSVNTSRITVTSRFIGKLVRVDLRIDNVSAGFWGWSLPTVSWNPAVMNLTNVREGTFLTDKTDASAFFIGNSPNLWNNTDGEIESGLSEALSSPGTSIDSSGVLATLTFKTTGCGNSSINVAGAYTVSSFSRANSILCPHTMVPSRNATVAVLSAGSSPQKFPLWTIASMGAIPLLGILAYLLKKRTVKMPRQ